jgi:hypothetical protein
MKMQVQKTMESTLLTIRKIDALKTFGLPTLDFMILNRDLGENQLKKTDQHICQSIDTILRPRGLPVEIHRAPWRDAGLSCPSLMDQRKALMIRLFTEMMLSKGQKIRGAIQS